LHWRAHARNSDFQAPTPLRTGGRCVDATPSEQPYRTQVQASAPRRRDGLKARGYVPCTDERSLRWRESS
jgi:hypothetical protein